MSSPISWSIIDSEVEEFQNGYRTGFVSIFKKYEGMETDERTAQNKVVKVTVSSFARHYGINERTFLDWTRAEDGVERHDNRPTISAKFNQIAEDAAAKATAAAEAKAERDQRAAADRAKKEQEAAVRQARLEEKQAAEREAIRIRKEEQVKAAEASRKQREEDAKRIAELEKSVTVAAESSSFDLTTLSREQKAEIMTVLANDPEQATEWFKAQEDARKAKNTAAAEKAAEAHRKRIEQMEDRERRTSLAKASEDYEHSALKAFLKLEAAAQDVKVILEDKGGVTFSQIISSKRLANEWITATELVEDVAVAVRESIFEANAESQLQDVVE